MTVNQIFDITMEGWGVVILLLAAIVSLIPGYKLDSEKRLVQLEINDICVLITDILAWVYRGNTSTVGYYMVRISNFLTFVFSFLLIVSMSRYVLFFIKRDYTAKLYLYTMHILAGIGIGLTIFNIWSGWLYSFTEENVYYRGPGANYAMAIALITLIFNGIIVLFNYRDMTPARAWSFWSYILIPVCAIVIQMNIYGISLTNIAYTIAIIIAFFVTMAERASMMVNQEREMQTMQNKLMLSQIQPHFLFNCLSSIYYLCAKDAKIAQGAIGQFAEYLRVNIDSLYQEYPIPFEQEMHHVENYLSLEQLRFNENLLIDYDIQATDFKVPALSVQPIVENAVKYGISKKIGGGTLKISTREYPKYFKILIEDDGMGYDVYTKKEDGRTHIGIDNVKNRLEIMVGGQLTIESTLGVGTKATIIIPKEEELI